MKKWVWGLFAVALAVIWGIRYHAVNTEYNEILPENPVKIYGVGDWVPFETDFLDYDSSGEGYSIRVDRYEVVSRQEAMERWNADESVQIEAGDKFLIVYVTHRNESGKDGIMLTDLKMSTVDTNLFMNWGLLSAANKLDDGSYGILLAQGTEHEVILPFSARSFFFSAHTWKHLETEKFYLQVTAYAIKKIIALGT